MDLWGKIPDVQHSKPAFISFLDNTIYSKRGGGNPWAAPPPFMKPEKHPAVGCYNYSMTRGLSCCRVMVVSSCSRLISTGTTLRMHSCITTSCRALCRIVVNYLSCCHFLQEKNLDFKCGAIRSLHTLVSKLTLINYLGMQILNLCKDLNFDPSEFMLVHT